MKIFSWMQSKLDRRQEKQKPSLSSASVQSSDTRKEEFSDWPETLLAIGTFGNGNKANEDPAPKPDNSQSSSQDDISVEEVSKLTKELTKLLSRKPKASTNGPEKPLNRFLNCPSSLEVGRTVHGDNGGDDSDLSADAKIVLNKAKDLLVDNRGGVREMSLSFLLRKMFVCHGGFAAPAPSLKDPLPAESRTEKILRKLLDKKIYPQSTLQPLAKKLSTKKFMETRHEERLQSEDRRESEDEDRSKWVKTDSEYIVLEI